jgi:hypothetical protein
LEAILDRNFSLGRSLHYHVWYETENTMPHSFLRLAIVAWVALVMPSFAAPEAFDPSSRTPSAVAGEPDSIEPGLQNRSDILFFSGYESEPWESAWGMKWGPSPKENLTLVSGKDAFRGRSARVRYPKGTIGGDSACQYLCPFEKMGFAPRDACYIRYYLRFDPGFDFVKGGKLPGLVGGKGNTGGQIPNGSDGWSSRLMWRSGGRVVQYVYHPDQKGVWGDDLDWMKDGKPCYFKPGVWHCVESYVKLNTPGKHDGIIRSYLDGEQVLEVKTLRFRDVQELQIDGFYFSTFFGGGDLSWAPEKDQYVQFDDFVLANGYVGPVSKDLR